MENPEIKQPPCEMGEVYRRLVVLEDVVQQLIHPKIKMVVLPGGKAPRRMSGEAAGFEGYLRGIVRPSEMDPKNPLLRKSLFDFEHVPSNPNNMGHVRELKGELVYRLDPNESVLVGIGFLTELPVLPLPMFYWVTPRSGLASKHKITITNAPGTVDADYRGEAGVLVHNESNISFDLSRDMRIAQNIYQWALIPEVELVSSVDQLSSTGRSTGGFGSTGLGGSFSPKS